MIPKNNISGILFRKIVLHSIEFKAFETLKLFVLRKIMDIMLKSVTVVCLF